MTDELLTTVAQTLRAAGVAEGRVYGGIPDIDRIRAEAPLVFVRLHDGPSPALGSSEGTVLDKTMSVDGEITLQISERVYEATLQVDAFAHSPKEGGQAEIGGLVDVILSTLDGVVLPAEELGDIGMTYLTGARLSGTTNQNIKHALRFKAVYHRISEQPGVWSADTQDIILDEEE